MAEIYALKHPETGEVRYIGKANDAAKRLQGHIYDCSRKKTPVARWIKKLLLLGMVPQVEVIEVCDDWQEAEIRQIAKYREGGRLLNVADGGEQPYCPKGTRQENGRAAAKSRVSTEFKARVYRLNHMLGILNRGGYFDESVKVKLRYAAAKSPDLFGRWASI